MDDACPHGVVSGQCMVCLAEHLDAETAMLAQIRTWRSIPPARESLREGERRDMRPQATLDTYCEGCDTTPLMRPEMVLRWWCGTWMCEDCIAEIRNALGEDTDG
jgi:hypothetical protein